MNDKTPDSNNTAMNGNEAMNGYGSLLGDIKERIRSAKYAALSAVNRELIGLYWDIGRAIVKRQKGDKWGRAVVEILAKDLQSEFPGIRGFSSHSIWRIRKLYLAYHKNEKRASLMQEIGWTHNIVVMEKCKDDLQREFYIRMTRSCRRPNRWLC